ncbi:MAG: carboxypeptidase regulatory-like domain-containing protein [Acidobacteriaceae bacterium]
MKHDPTRAFGLARKTMLALASAVRTGVVLAGGIMLATTVQAQYRASVTGTVTDTSGAVIPGATVTLSDTETNKVMTATSDPNGLYTFNALPPSRFTIVAEKQGFATTPPRQVQVVPEEPNAVNIQMSVAGSSQTVTVSANAQALLTTETASVSGTIDSNQIQHLPSFGRDVFQLVQLTPGVFGDAAQQSGGGSQSLPGSNRSGSGSSEGIFTTENAPQVVANGGHNEANGISIDGISTVSAVWGGASVVTPSEDSVKDVHVVSNGYDASNGRFSAAQIQVVTKNGTNDVHGSLFFKADRPGLNAYQRWNGPGSEVPGTPDSRGLLRNTSRFNQFGGSLGGPLWKNKLFAFFNYETLRNNSTGTATGWYETPQFLTQGRSGSIANSMITFPGEGAHYSSIVPQSCGNAGLVEGVNCHSMGSQGLDIGSPLTTPLGTHDPSYASVSDPGVGSGLDGVPDIAFVNTTNPTQVTEAQYNGRLDANVTSRDLLTFTIYWVPADTSNYNGTVRSANLYHHSAINDAFTVLWNHTFSPSLLNEARANAAGWRWNEITTNPQEPFGLPQVSFGPAGSQTSFGGIQLQDFGAPGPSVFNQWTYGYSDTLTKILGRHSIKAGGELTRLYYLNEATYNARPSYNFLNVWDFLNDAPNGETGTFDPLTGTPTSNRQDTRANLWGFFVQDDFKIRPNLTINAGLRWSYFGPLSTKQNNLSTVVTGTGASLLNAVRLRQGGNLFNPQKMNFGPQLGFAWSPVKDQGRFVLRGGFGINYNQEEMAISANGNGNPPHLFNAHFCCSTFGSPDPNILYGIPSDPKSLFGYPSNPATLTAFDANFLPVNGATSLTGYPSDLPTNYTYHYSLDTQYDLGANWVATIGYQGSIGRHLIRQYDLNSVAVARAIPFNPHVSALDFFGNDGNSRYDALLTSLRHQFSKTFMLEAQYVWSKSMDQSSQPYWEDPYPNNPRNSWGRSDYNVADGFKIYGLWQPKFFTGGHDWLEKVAGGWSLSAIVNAHTGFPWTPLYQTGTLYYGGSPYSNLRPAAITKAFGKDLSNAAFESGPNPSSDAVNRNFPDGGTAYFAQPNAGTAPAFPAQGTLPDQVSIQRNTLTGPRYFDTDATLTKAFGLPNNKILGENAQVEFRADAFNLWNQVNLKGGGQSNGGSIVDNVTSPNFGQAQNALGSRTLELQARFHF